MKLPMTATAPSTPAEQSLSTFLHVETMNDLDDGRSTLLAATETNLGDLRETSPARVLGMVEEARAALDALARMAREFEARDTLAAIVAEHDLILIEEDMSDLREINSTLADVLICYAALHKDGRTVVYVPVGQDPIERVDGVANLVIDLHAQAEAQA